MSDLTLYGGDSPFDAVKSVRPDRSEYWTGRGLQPLMDYGQWVKFQFVIEKARAACALVEGEDAAALHFPKRESDGGRWGNQRIEDYELTRHAAYLVAMAGDDTKRAVAEARVYFAVRTREAETRPAPAAFPVPTSFAEALELAARQARDIEEGQRQLAEARPKVEAHDAYIGADGLLLVREAAKLLGVQEKTLRKHLHAKKILMSHPSRRNEPYAEHVTAGRFEVKARSYEHPDGPVATHTTYVTPVGLEWLRGSLERAGLGARPRLTSISGGVA